jgi:hypothetical protein
MITKASVKQQSLINEGKPGSAGGALKGLIYKAVNWILRNLINS